MTDTEMLKRIWDELTYVRGRLDDHIDDEDKAISKIREELASNRGLHRLINGSLTIGIAGLVTWLLNSMGFGK